jgi:tetratricopeptide (TPR) repeat protein
MDYYTQYKTFIRGYRTLSEDHRRYKSFYKDRRLTQVEKQILKGHFNLKKGKYKDAIASLKDLSIQSEFLNGIRLIILSACFNNSMQLELAQKSALLAYELFSSIDEKDFIYTPLTQVIISAGNQKNLPKMKKYIDILEKYPRDDDYKMGLYYQCKAFYYLIEEKLGQALELLETAIKEHSIGIKDRLSYLYVMMFMAQFKLKNIDECENILQKYKSLGGYKVKSNFKFMNSLLKFIYNNSPIYCYHNDFKNTPSLGWELFVIKSLSVGDMDTAEHYWKKLMLTNPALYQEKFQYSGDYCLFSVALAKFDIVTLLKRQKNEVENFTEDEDFLVLKSYSAKLEYILKKSDGAVSCDQLIKYLWGEKADYSAIKKLKTQVSRLRSKKKLDIQFENDAYYLVKASNS